MKHHLIKQASGGFATKVASAILTFLVTLFLARYLEPEKFGVYSIAMSITNIIAGVITLGLPMLVVRQVAIYESQGNWPLLKGIVNRGYLWPLAASAMVFGVGGLTYWWILPLHREMLVMILVLSTLLALNRVRAAALRGLHWVVLADVPELLLRPLLMMALIFVTIGLAEVVPTEYWAMTIQIGAAIVSFMLGVRLLQKRLPIEIKTVSAEYTDKAWFLAGMTFLSMSMVSALESQMALLMLGAMQGAKAAGLFQAAFQLVTPLISGLLAVNMALQSKLAAAWAKGDKIHAQKLVREAAKLGMIVALSVVAVLLIFAEELLSLFGLGYVGAATALRILVVGQLVNAGAGSCGIVLSMTGHQREVLHAVILALCVNAVTGLILIPRFDVVGAAVAASMGLITWNVFLVRRASMLLGIKTTFL